MNRKWIMLIALIALGAGAYYWQVSGNQPAQAARGAALVAVVVPELSAAEQIGKTTYDANCASCHGANGAGQDGVAPPFVHRVYEPNHHGDGAFYSAAQNGVRAHHWSFGDMPPVAGITQDEVAQILTYVRALQRANGIE